MLHTAKTIVIVVFLLGTVIFGGRATDIGVSSTSEQSVCVSDNPKYYVIDISTTKPTWHMLLTHIKLTTINYISDELHFTTSCRRYVTAFLEFLRQSHFTDVVRFLLRINRSRTKLVWRLSSNPLSIWRRAISCNVANGTCAIC